jgi:glyoxylase-like metal-dependent hydrolase (beta-lactamase superfamily II)
MKKIKNSVYIENNYSGVTVGALLFSEGTVLVDAPLVPDEGRAWLAALVEAGAQGRRVLVNLDSHPDRSLGAQTLESQVITHQDTADHFNLRASIFKAVRQESGAVWENLGGLASLRWKKPDIVFDESVQLHFGGQQVDLFSMKGPGPGAIWLQSADERVVFVGDTVMRNQVPFLALADIPAWVESLDQLMSKEYKGYRIISGRSGEVKVEDVRAQKAMLKDIDGRLARLAARKMGPGEVEKLVPKLMEKYKFPVKDQALYTQRLSYGLREYYQNQVQVERKTSSK